MTFKNFDYSQLKFGYTVPEDFHKPGVNVVVYVNLEKGTIACSFGPLFS